MSVYTDRAIVLDTPDEIEAAAILAIRAGLRMQVKGYRMSSGRSALAVAKARGLTTKGTAKGALAEVSALIADRYGL